MKSRRTAKVAEAIRQVVSSAILFELRDPRVQGVTILRSEVAADLRTAKVYVSVLGDEKTERLTMQGLNAARGWLQSRIADQMQLRLTPVLTFVSDQGVKKSIEVSQMLHELKLESNESSDEETTSENHDSVEDENRNSSPHDVTSDSLDDLPEQIDSTEH